MEFSIQKKNSHTGEHAEKQDLNKQDNDIWNHICQKQVKKFN